MSKKIDKDGKFVDDAKSTPLARSNAFARLAGYVPGKAIQPLLGDHAEGNVLDVFRRMSDTELDEIIAEAQRALQNENPTEAPQPS